MHIFKSLTVLLVMIPLLSSCSLFQPSEKVIEYDEEVKLHDGSMVWVHIKRHYFLTGGALGDAGWNKPAYMPSAVEISWDTGFPNVGRKSVFFDNSFEFIDKYQNLWYISGGMNNPANISKNGYEGIGNRSKYSAYFYVIDDRGEFLINRSEAELPDSTVYNILDLRGLKDISNPPVELENKKLSWQQKLEMHRTQTMYGSYFEKSVKNN